MGKKVIINNNEVEYELAMSGSSVEITLGGKAYRFNKEQLNLENDGAHYVLNNKDFFIEKAGGRRKKSGDEGGSVSPMPGKILKVLVKDGDLVKKGDALIIMEAMKMEHTLKASKDGVVKKVKYSEGDLVEGQIELVELDADV